MAQELDALSVGKFGNSLYLKEFPAKIRVLTRDPMVYNNFGNTYYAFAVYNLETKRVQILAKGPGFARRFQELNSEDFGGDVRKLDIRISTNGKNGLNVRYSIDAIGAPSDMPQEVIKEIMDNGFDLAEKVKKSNPGALRLSEINAGAKLPESDEGLQPNATTEDVVIEDIGDQVINLNDIPF